MTKLCQLAEKFGTDKWPGWANNTGHSYTPFYYELLKDKGVYNLLEIGICSNSMGVTGPSLHMWEAFFPKAAIYGIDNCPWVMVNENRIKSFEMAQEAIDLEIIAPYGPFDVIIDDGSHEPEHQIKSANDLIPLLAPNGIYIVEDVRDGVKEQVQAGINYPSTVFEFNVQSKPDDRIITICG